MQSPKDMALVATLAAIAQRAERYVYSTDPERTRNPGYHPVPLAAGMNLQMIPFPRFQFSGRNSGEIKVLQDLEACEPGEEITITLRPPAGNALTDVDARGLCPQLTSRPIRSLCSQLTPRSKRMTPKDRLVIQPNIKEASNEES